MTAPVIAAKGSPIIRDYWRSAPQGVRVYNVTSVRDVDAEAGYEPTFEARLGSLYEAEVYVAKWQEVYPDRLFFIN